MLIFVFLYRENPYTSLSLLFIVLLYVSLKLKASRDIFVIWSLVFYA